MKAMIPVKGYSRPEASNHETDFKDLLKSITPLTKIGAVCFVIGKHDRIRSRLFTRRLCGGSLAYRT